MHIHYVKEGAIKCRKFITFNLLNFYYYSTSFTTNKTVYIKYAAPTATCSLGKPFGIIPLSFIRRSKTLLKITTNLSYLNPCQELMITFPYSEEVGRTNLRQPVRDKEGEANLLQRRFSKEIQNLCKRLQRF